MRSRTIKTLQHLSPSALCLVLSGCFFGENQTFYGYRNPQARSEIHSETPSDTVTGSFSDHDTDSLTDTLTDTLTSTSVNTSTQTESASLTLCCNLQTGSVIPASETGCQNGLALTPVQSANECRQLSEIPTALTHETFSAASGKVKKIDFLFVVDNSGSMADNQAKLAEGFESFANTFYRREDLDICTAIITTDRYLGKTNSAGYSRERILPCTKPQGWSELTASQREMFIQSLIQEFKNQVNVGTQGSGTEMPGKSLVSFLYELPQWKSGFSAQNHTSFFRPDAVANISFVTDENNWFYRDENPTESKNDLPPVTNAPINEVEPTLFDSRKGIKNHLDEFFLSLNPGQTLTYSVTSFLETDKSPQSLPGLSMNLAMIHTMVKRESARADISAPAEQFAAVYRGVGEGIVVRASAITLSHPIYEPAYPAQIQDLNVNLIQPGSNPIRLSFGQDFTLLMPNGIILNEVTRNQIGQEDQIDIEYRYEIRN